jgi:hypothetical protein
MPVADGAPHRDVRRDVNIVDVAVHPGVVAEQHGPERQRCDGERREERGARLVPACARPQPVEETGLGRGQFERQLQLLCARTHDLLPPHRARARNRP